MTHPWRYWLIVALLVIAVTGIIARIVDLMVVQRKFLLSQGDSRSLRMIKIPAYRGMITDRNGKPLAVSVPVDNIWIDPQKFSPEDSNLHKLAETLNEPLFKIRKVYRNNEKREFAYLKREVTPYIGLSVKTLKIPGVYVSRQFKRYYPDGEVAAQLVGFTNIDDKGQAGIELEYNKWLQGVPGEKEVLVNRMGKVVASVQLIKAARPGHNLALSINSQIQYIAYRALKEAVKRHQADSGSVVVMDAKTGEVLAMADYPSFNPNNRPKIQDGRFRNRAVTDITEPGSTIKAFTVANALASGKYTPTTPINTAPGWMLVDGKTVRDDADYGLLDVTGVLQKSSNVGASKMTLSLPPVSLYDLLKKVGFGTLTASGFPGASPGFLPLRAIENPFDLATLSFGYGIAVTNLQLAHAYTVLADDGLKNPVSLLRLNQAPVPQRVISKKIANEVLVMLESVIEKGGTATRAEVPGYRVSGKTGTVRMVGAHGYEPHHHTAIFVGVAPVSNPQLVISVIVKNPERGGYFGGLVSAPIFAKVMGVSLRILDIPPDKPGVLQNDLLKKYLDAGAKLIKNNKINNRQYSEKKAK